MSTNTKEEVKKSTEVSEEKEKEEAAGEEGSTSSESSKPSENNEKLTKKHILLIIEMFFISLAVSYTEVCVVPALPHMSEQWSDNAAFVPWVLSSFNMVGAVATSIFGYFSGMYGPKYPIIVSFIFYALGQLGCALSNGIFLMIAFRAVQGIGMSIYVIFYSVTNIVIPKKYVPIVIGILTTNMSVGTAVGLVGGSLTMDNIPHWEDVFWTTFPIIIIFGIAFAFTFTDEENRKGGVADRSTIPPFDFVGPILLSIGLILFLASFTFSDTRGWDALVISFMVIGIVILIIFGVYEYMIDHPLIPVKYIFTRDIGIVMIVSFLLGVVALSVIQITPYLLLSPENTIVKNKKMVYAGLLMLPFGIVELIVAPIVGYIGKKVGFSICVTFGALFQCASLIYLTFLHYNIGAILVGFILYGGTSGTIYVASMDILAELVPPHIFSVLSGTYLLFNVMGSAVGPVIVDLISRKKMYYGSDASSSYEPVYASDEGYKLGFVFITAAAALEFIVSFGISDKFHYCKAKNASEAELEEEKYYETQSAKLDGKHVEFDLVSMTPLPKLTPF